MAAIVAGGAAVLAAGPAAALASYGPPPPPPTSPVPGGFYCVVTSQTVGRAGKHIGPLKLGQVTASITIPRDDFYVPAQVTITEPYGSGGCTGGSGIGDAGYPGYRAIGGVGILVQRHGITDHRRFRHSLTLVLAARAMGRHSFVVKWTGYRFRPATEVIGRHSATVRVGAVADFADLVRVRHGHGHGHQTAVGAAVLRMPVPADDLLAAARLLPSRLPPGSGVLAAAPRLGVLTSRSAVLTP